MECCEINWRKINWHADREFRRMYTISKEYRSYKHISIPIFDYMKDIVLTSTRGTVIPFRVEKDWVKETGQCVSIDFPNKPLKNILFYYNK